MEKANNPPKDHYYDVIVQFMNGMTYVFFTILLYRARLYIILRNGYITLGTRKVV